MFYDTRKLSLEEKQALCQRARELCFTWWVDILDCSKSWCRQKIDMSFEDIMTRLTEQSIFSVIHRKVKPENHLEIAFETLASPFSGEPNYFLWILVKPEFMAELTQNLHAGE